MTVRPAEDRDRAAVVDLLRKAHAAAGYRFAFDPVRAAELFRLHRGAGASCLVLGDGEGVLMANAFEHPFGAGRWSKETTWFIDPSARGRSAMAMLDAYEDWARGEGVVTAGMASLAGNDVSALYRRRGYEPAETHFVKHLG